VGDLQERVGALQDAVRGLEAGQRALRGEFGQACGELDAYRRRCAADREHLGALAAALDAVSAAPPSPPDQLAGVRGEGDLARSKLEVPTGMFDEFQQWKAAHPLPAEPLVSVCVATYNRAGLLTERCLPSVLGQTYRRFELIVVGDGCTDE